MDVLKELFGGQDEDFEAHIAKSLFGRQESEQIGCDGCSNGSVVDPSGSKPAGRVQERTELPPTQSTFPPLSLPSHSGTDIAAVPEQMPMYLLEDDEGNDEEIIQLLQTTTEHPDISSTPPGPVRSQSLSNSVSVQFPWMTSSVGLNVTPLQVLPNPVSTKKPRHGGGWPKGKSRKPPTGLPPLPKPPTSGYGLFLAENMAKEKLKTSSMSQVSKQLGKLWSELNPADKRIYHERSEGERERYLRELRRYLLATGGVCTEEVDGLLSRALATENDDKQLLCDVCKLTFTSLHNKRCHYSGRLHTQTLVELLRPQSVQNGDNLISSLCSQAIKFNGCVTLVGEERNKHNHELLTYASLQQTTAELEFNYTEAEAMLKESKERWTNLQKQHRTLISVFLS